MYQIYLKDGSEIQAASMTFEPHIVVVLESKDQFVELWEKLNAENLEIFEVYENGVRLTGFTGVELAGIQIIPGEVLTSETGETLGQTHTVHFYFEGRITESVDPDYKTAYEMITGEYDA